MTNPTQALLKASLKRYKTPTTKDAFSRGFDRGYSIASWQNLPSVGETVLTESEGLRLVVTEENQFAILESLAFQGEDNDRQYSPFEFTAAEFNKARNDDARWNAFNDGITEGIQANVSERHEAYSA